MRSRSSDSGSGSPLKAIGGLIVSPPGSRKPQVIDARTSDRGRGAAAGLIAIALIVHGGGNLLIC